MKKYLRILNLLAVLIFFGVSPLSGQDQEMGEMAMMERVAFLQHQLESAKVAEREEAEKELLKLGPAVLDYLEPTTPETPSDALQRLGKIRISLEKLAVESVTKASKVTLQGNMSVDDVLKAIAKQTKNDVALPEETPDILSEKKIDVNFEGVDFWVALADVMKKGELEIDPYAGEAGQLRVTPTQASRMAAANPDAPVEKAKPLPVPPRNQSGIFDLTVTRVHSSRNLENPDLNFCNVNVRVRWEPRVQPISIQLPASTIKAIDEYDNSIEVPNPDGVLSGMVQPEIPELDFQIPIGLVDRQIEVINSFEATVNAVLPGRTETFKFKDIGKLAEGAEQQKAGAIVTFGGIRKNEDLYGVTVRLSFDEKQNALESHQGWAFDNKTYLLDAEGNKYEAITYETLRQDGEQMAIQYYYEQDPKNMTLVYKTPAAIVELPIKIKLTKIPLP